ncbi:DJ-1/PfpI family protein [Sutcliffiella halmapala]|uniref:DJ-1/PfpI family protein n=1 Tax=Sutcliffiella halmapala TaxID=79882 RepID=UPI000994C03F|nr:DJ-1/PfpI family protein [Sutcliffiella halmapala]
MKALFFLYEGYVDWEISALTYMLWDSKIEIKTTALSSEVTHIGGFRIAIDLAVEECNPSDFDILIIPGGDPGELVNEKHLLNIIRGFDAQNKYIAAICGAPTFLAAAGVLKERKYSTSIEEPEYTSLFDEQYKSEKDVTVCENLITAEGNAYIEFAIEVGKKLKIFKDREDELETVLFFKNQLRG